MFWDATVDTQSLIPITNNTGTATKVNNRMYAPCKTGSLHSRIYLTEECMKVIKGFKVLVNNASVVYLWNPSLFIFVLPSYMEGMSHGYSTRLLH